MQKLWVLFVLWIGSLLIGCGNATPDALPQDNIPTSTPVVIPSTFTPPPPEERLSNIPVVTVTQAPLPTMETSTPIPFGANVVELRLTIPSIGYDRRLQGSVSSQLIIVDESNGFSVQRDNQASVLLDLQQVLPELVLAAVPEGCESCVQFSYSLPFSGVEGEGWLRDPVLLASLENYFTTTLGPHFPAEAIIGLRRSASPYAPAHMVAVTADGRLFRWLVSEGEAEPADIAPPGLLDAFERIDPQMLAQQYTAPCPGSALESLFLAGREDERLIAIVCPEFAIPTDLQTVYMALDASLDELLLASEDTIARPPAAFPLSAVLDYQRLDGAQLTIFADDTTVASSPTITQPVTTTLSSSQVISLTTDLLASGSLRTGLTTFLSPAGDVDGGGATPRIPRTLLVVRGSAGVYDAQWFTVAIIPELADLDDLLNQIVGIETAVPTQTAEPTPEPIGDEPVTPAPSSTPGDG